MDVHTELELVAEITEELDPAETAHLRKAEAAELVEIARDRTASVSSDQALSELFGMAALHPNAHIRYGMVNAVRDHHENVFAREFAARLTHDDEDFVAFAALRVCRDLEIHRSIDDLVSISSWPSSRLETGKKPVGVGHAAVLDAVLSVFGTRNPDEVEHIEETYKQKGRVPIEYLSKPSWGAGSDVTGDSPAEMVEVPGGAYEIGVDADRLPRTRFRNDDFTTTYEVNLSAYYIDRYPVTNSEYDEFVAEMGDHTLCHPGEPDDKDHRRNTLGDDRVGPDHPVTGIDYYDAYAYAQWVGKDLPTEEEWEVAVRGPNGDMFPWGNEWEPSNCNWAGRAFNETVDDLETWRETLTAAHRMEPHPDEITTPVDAFPENESPFGVRDAIGNVWEYTKTNFFSRQEMYPVFSHSKRAAHEHLMENPDAFPVIRGGAWSSIPEMTTGPYRGKDLMTDRHNEIGFRCVRRG